MATQSPGQLAPTEYVHAEKPVASRSGVRLQIGIIECRGCEYQFCQSRLELRGFCQFVVNIVLCKGHRRPPTSSLALHSDEFPRRATAIDVDPTLSLALPSVTDHVAIAPFQCEEI